MSACGYPSIDYNFLISSQEKFVYEERRIVSVEMKAIHFKSIYSGSAVHPDLNSQSFVSCQLSNPNAKDRGNEKGKRERYRNTPSDFWLNTYAQWAPTLQLTHVKRFLTNTFVLTEKGGRAYFARCWRQTLTFNSRQSFRVCLENQCLSFANLMKLQREVSEGPSELC